MNFKTDKQEISRRRFLSSFVKGIAGIVTVAVATPVVGYVLSPIWKKDNPVRTPVATLSEIPVGMPTYVTYELRLRDGWYVTTVSQGVWVVNKGSGNISIFDPRCTHLNCPFYWDEKTQVFQCPCHDGKFDIDGNVVGGPPPRPLDSLEYFIDGETILLSGTIIRGE